MKKTFTSAIYFDPEHKLSKRELKFKEILDKSREIFASHGYKKASIDLVAKAVKLQKGSLYYYFKSKEELFFEVVRYEGFLFGSTIQNIISKEKTVKDKLIRYFLLRMEIPKKLNNIYSITDSVLELFPYMMKIKQEFFFLEKDFIASLLEQGINDGIFKRQDIEMLSVAIVSSMRGLEQLMMSSDTDYLQEDVLLKMSDILFHGICK